MIVLILWSWFAFLKKSIAILFAIIGSYYVIEDIFNLTWGLNLNLIMNIGLSIGAITLILILFTNFKYLSPKVYPLIRNQ